MTEQNAAELISVPQGGGAVKGLGETFQPDLHTGTGNYSVPLDLPAGRGSLAPSLALSYSSGNGNGPLGLGWQLPVPGVRRKTDKGIPRYDDRDVFILSGAEDLVAVRGGAAGVQRYRPQTESLYARIEHHTDGTDHWMVWAKDGLRSFYGTPTPEDAPAGWLDPAIVADPDDLTRIYGWLLTRTEDTFGNSIAYSYQPDPTDTTGAQRYLASIGYADYGDAQDLTYLVQVRFTVESRYDVHTDRRPGFALSTGARYAGIETWTVADTERLARSFALAYTDGSSRSPDNGASLLSRVTVTGHDGDDEETLPPLEFGYTGWDPTRRVYRPVAGSVPATALSKDCDLVDLFGCGLPDVLQLAGGVARYWRNLGHAELSTPRPVSVAPTGVALGSAGVQLLDADGDGRPDLFVATGSRGGYYPIGTDGGFDPRGYVSYPVAPSFDLTDANTRLVDLDGDGVTDVLHIGTELEVYLNNRAGGWTQQRVPGSPLRSVTLADPRVKLADMTGDGLTDVVLVGNGHLSYWPNQGYGSFGSPIRMSGSPRFADANVYGSTGFDPTRLLLGDIDGDGLADVAYVGTRGTTVWMNQAGTGFAAPLFVPATPQPDSSGAVRLADLLGCGTSGILWSYDGRSTGEAGYKFLDFTGGSKPYLLSTIDNHVGGRTTINYGSSTQFALADAAAGTPWMTTLPFPVQVVTSIVTAEEFSSSTTSSEFSYHHGYWDGADREFRGFGRVVQHDTTVFDPGSGLPPQQFSPPTETRTWFHCGPVGPALGNWAELDFSAEYWAEDQELLGGGDRSLIPSGLARPSFRQVVRALRGSVLRSELYGLDGDLTLQGHPYTVTEHCYDLAPVIDPEPGGDANQVDDYWLAAPVVAVRPSGSRTTQWERGADPLTTLAYQVTFDQYGNPTGSMDVAVPRGHDGTTGDPYLVTATTTGYAVRDDADRYICDRVSGRRREEMLNDGSLSLADLKAAVWSGQTPLPGRTLEFSHILYDGAPFEGLPPGELGDHGVASATATLNLTRGGLGQSHDPADLPPYLDGLETRLTNGLRGDYYRDTAMTDLAFARADQYIGFDWWATSPDPYLTQQTFAVCWTGQLHPDYSETYTLSTEGTGGARMWLDGALIIDAWDALDGAAATAALTAGTSHDIVVEYQAADWDRSIALRWASPSQPHEIIDQDHLTPPADFTPQAWDPSYPNAFQSTVAACAGYVYHFGQLDDYDAGYYSVTGASYDNRGLLSIQRDALGRDTTIEYDDYDLLPVSVTDPAGLERTAAYDYRILKPYLVTDVNDNRTQLGYSPLGLPLWSAALGKDGQDAGDTTDQPGTVYTYDLTAYDDSQPDARRPVSVHTVRRVDYRWTIVDQINAQRAASGQDPLTDVEIDALFPADEERQYPERFIQSRAFNDGAGRALQTRTQSDTTIVEDLGLPGDITIPPGPCVTHESDDVDSPPVVVSGWKTYDNKGRVVQAWEPFFDTGWDYAEPTDVLAMLASSTTSYDPRGRQLRIVHPDASEDSFVYGEVPDPTTPDAFVPNPWDTFHYDVNDNAGRTHAGTSQGWSDHWNTPASTVVDAMGRVTTSVERLDQRELTTSTTYDIEGHVVEVVDTLGRTVSTSDYDLAGRAWRSTLLDAGTSQTVFDVVGGVVEQRDSKGAVQLSSYDVLRRPRAAWACDAAGTPITLREVHFYGDSANLADPVSDNLCGRPYRTYDEAGTLETSAYDLAGRLLESTRRVLSSATILAAFPDTYVADWLPANGNIEDIDALEALAAARADAADFVNDQTWDALGRATSTTTPVDSAGNRHVVLTSYARSGALASITLDDDTYLAQAAYNARGQRVAGWLGNGILTRSSYDPLTFHLVRQRSEAATDTGNGIWQGAGAPHQDTGYGYDLIGNPLAIQERTPGCGAADTPTPDALDRTLSYDSVYRLTNADGREAKDPAPYLQAADQRSSDPTATQTYRESYDYDDVGNLLNLKHNAASAGYTRTMNLVAGSNRLATMDAGGAFAYTYDDAGNMTTETTSRLYGWNAKNQLTSFRVQPTPKSPPSVWSQCRYGASGTRVLKVVRDQSGALETTIYPGGPLERIVLTDTGGTATSYDELHVHDGAGRLAVKRLDAMPDDQRPPIAYHLADHLGSNTVTLDGTGAPVNREEYLPYGETGFGSYARKRYRYTGRERDEESGLNYHSARYYAPWLARWTSNDPLQSIRHISATQYALGNPVRYVDVSGLAEENQAPPPALTGTEVAQRSHSGDLLPQTLKTGALPGTQAGVGAAQYWADVSVAAEREGGFWGDAKWLGASVMGSFASLWTPETSRQTAFTLGTAGLGAFAQAGRLGVASLPVARALAFSGSFSSGLSLGQAATGINLTGAPLTRSERVTEGISGAIGIASLGIDAVRSRGFLSGGLEPPTSAPSGMQKGRTAIRGLGYGAPQNAPTVIGDRPYSGHALDRMQGRGIPPSAVENAIRTGSSSTGVRTSGGLLGNSNTVYKDPTNGTTVVVDTFSGRTVTTF